MSALGKLARASAYVAYGVDEETRGDFRYWIAIWNDDGPCSTEKFTATRTEAQRVANEWAQAEGLEAVEVDEFGAVA